MKPSRRDPVRWKLPASKLHTPINSGLRELARPLTKFLSGMDGWMESLSGREFDVDKLVYLRGELS